MQAVRVHGGKPLPACHDYSAPMNPLGPPPWLWEVVGECRPKSLTMYPDWSYEGLREAVAVFHGVDAASVAVANGASELLSLLPLLLRAKRIVVLEPNYGDHHLLETLGFRLTRIPLRLGAGIECGFDPSAVADAVGEQGLAILSRPNNPTGCLVPEDLVYDTARRLAARGSALVADEAYIDLSPGAKPLQPEEGLIIVRSLTKTFATPGLRFGYMIAGRDVVSVYERVRQPWPVGGLEACVYERLLRDGRSSWYVSRARLLVSEEAPRLCSRLRVLGYKCRGTSAPFILLEHPWISHPNAWWRLAAWGVCVRDASSFWGLTRFHSRLAIRTPGENDAALRALERLAGERGDAV